MEEVNMGLTETKYGGGAERRGKWLPDVGGIRTRGTDLRPSEKPFHMFKSIGHRQKDILQTNTVEASSARGFEGRGEASITERFNIVLIMLELK